MGRLPLLLAVLGLLLIGGGFTYGAYERVIADPGAVPLPPSIAGLPLAEELSGAGAAQNIAELHRQQFPLSGAAVGTYRDAGASATLWVSASPLPLLAAQMVGAMEKAIGRGASPFVPVEVRQDGGRPVHALTGMGQHHFYFRSGNLVVWLAADERVAEAALAGALTFYD
jgi:hypothetical protein